MAKKIILYNLKESVSHEEYQRYCQIQKGPFIVSLPSCRSFKLLFLDAATKEGIPFEYIGIVDVESQEAWQKDSSSEAFQDFRKGWLSKIAEFRILDGKEVYGY